MKKYVMEYFHKKETLWYIGMEYREFRIEFEFYPAYDGVTLLFATPRKRYGFSCLNGFDYFKEIKGEV